MQAGGQRPGHQTALPPHLFFLVLLTLLAGCAPEKAMLRIEGAAQPLPVNVIWDTAQKRAVSFQSLVSDLKKARVVYVGEKHTNAHHHAIQLRIIEALADGGAPLRVGMEMFDHTYQRKLDSWSAGQWDWPTFLRQVHWYANWRYPDPLYKDILLFIQQQGLKLVGLNIPFHLPPKIAVGGLDSLSPSERALLPEEIDTSDPRHRAYVQEIYNLHRIRGRENFDYFYQAQCAWEDGMAQSVATNLGSAQMVVLAGNGHIIHKFGIPERAYRRKQAPYRTLYLATPDETVASDAADFIWVSEKAQHPPKP